MHGRNVAAAIFAVDILLKCFTSVFERGTIVNRFDSVLTAYLQSSLVFDLITTVALVVNLHSVVPLIFLTRLVYDDSWVRSVKAATAQLARVYIILQVAMAFIVGIFHLHIIACVWYFIGKNQ